LQVCAANYAALWIFVETLACCGTFARCGCASIGDVHEIHEVAKNRAARRRDCCRHLMVGCTGGIRARRLRSQPPSQCVWPMRIWRSKSKLVPENYGPSRYLRGRWSVALLQVIAFGAARGVQAANMRIPYSGGCASCSSVRPANMIGDVRRFSLRGLRGSCLQRVTLLAAMKPKQDLRTSVAVSEVRIILAASPKCGLLNQSHTRACPSQLNQGDSLRVCPKTSGGITKFSEHEAD
jgi:hypothetical protein